MNVFELAWYFEGEQAAKDVKFATIMATTMDEAKGKWLATEPNAKFLDAISKNLTA
jgi:hypothetical protein